MVGEMGMPITRVWYPITRLGMNYGNNGLGGRQRGMGGHGDGMVEYGTCISICNMDHNLGLEKLTICFLHHNANSNVGHDTYEFSTQIICNMVY